jgi:hypothetical protein
MKIRIEDNTVRFRLRKSEVTTLAESGIVLSGCRFPNETFSYSIRLDKASSGLAADMEMNEIKIFMPESWGKDWPNQDRIGFEADLNVGNSKILRVIIEKDFVCLDRDLKTQQDQFPHPKQQKL